MLRKKWMGFAGQIALIALSLLPIWWMSACQSDTPPPVTAFEVPMPESGQYFSGKVVTYPAFP
jgi:hypothetical protein